jgi:hypothetical protein
MVAVPSEMKRSGGSASAKFVVIGKIMTHSPVLNSGLYACWEFVRRVATAANENRVVRKNIFQSPHNYLSTLSGNSESKNEKYTGYFKKLNKTAYGIRHPVFGEIALNADP